MSLEATIEGTAALMKLLGDKTRLAMVALFAEEECCVCELVEIFSMSQPAVSQHLRKLRDAGLVQERRNKHWNFYSLNREHPMFPVVDALLAHVPDQNERLNQLKAARLRISCCD
ncbi:MAG TPA: metalloregulator ArsR/SmtB family transcription factor [Bacillales bacterium]|nr:metalloregulator ArsR/SmtB family transcription factor [Bacillales bacterium]